MIEIRFEQNPIVFDTVSKCDNLIPFKYRTIIFNINSNENTVKNTELTTNYHEKILEKEFLILV